MYNSFRFAKVKIGLLEISGFNSLYPLLDKTNGPIIKH